jgi:hypothetical protein
MLLLPAQAFVQAVEILTTLVGHDDHVLDPDPTNGLAVKSRLDRHDIPDDKLRTTDC